LQVRYGTSFGECIGYCKQNITVISGLVVYNKSGWIDTVETIICSESLADKTWDSLTSELDIDSFMDLDERIGCPDCADGGAEWLEVELKNGDKHKVTFEYYNAPSELESYIPVLRNLMITSRECVD